MGYSMKLELTRVGLLAGLANHYTIRGAFNQVMVDYGKISKFIHIDFQVEINSLYFS